MAEDVGAVAAPASTVSKTGHVMLLLVGGWVVAGWLHET